jgi:hypothetical protein
MTAKTLRGQQADVSLNLCATLIKLATPVHTNNRLPPAVVPVWDHTDKVSSNVQINRQRIQYHGFCMSMA